MKRWSRGEGAGGVLKFEGRVAVEEGDPMEEEYEARKKEENVKEEEP